MAAYTSLGNTQLGELVIGECFTVIGLQFLVLDVGLHYVVQR